MLRTAAREIAVHISFEIGVNPLKLDELLDTIFEKEYYKTLKEEAPAYTDYPNQKQMDYIKSLALGVSGHLAELDTYIQKYAKNWHVGRISRVAVAIMRVAMYEILYMPDIPPAASVNEAVELSKKYEEADTTAFINGILGSFIRGELSFDK
ncbi:MAG: transcription antitermination factor NusB [Clostridiales bacterium]|jgi:N utilization substance protein B|nr:transcription antitermination factor NusB [Clostridiales bacterium]